MSAPSLYNLIGRYFYMKFRQRVLKVGVPTVALQLKKQGVPVSIAALMLGRMV